MEGIEPSSKQSRKNKVYTSLKKVDDFSPTPPSYFEKIRKTLRKTKTQLVKTITSCFDLSPNFSVSKIVSISSEIRLLPYILNDYQLKYRHLYCFELF